MPPAKFKKPRDKTDAAKRREALQRLKNRWELESEDDEEWEPESEPIVTPMLASVEGGVDHCIQALRAHEDEDAATFLEMYDRATKTDLKFLTLEQIAHASGIGSLRLAEITQTALYLYGDRQTQMILSSSMPRVIKATIKAATDEVPIVADTLAGRVVVGRTNGDTKAQEMLLKARGVVPIPKGSQIAIQVNAGKEEKQDDSGRQWKWPEERTKQIMAVINPKQLEASTTRPSEHVHFDHSKPVVFEKR